MVMLSLVDSKWKRSYQGESSWGAQVGSFRINSELSSYNPGTICVSLFALCEIRMLLNNVFTYCKVSSFEKKELNKGCQFSFQRRNSFPLLGISFPLLVQIFCILSYFLPAVGLYNPNLSTFSFFLTKCYWYPWIKP